MRKVESLNKKWKFVVKPATLETGYVIQVPLFVNEGERVRVDTRTGEYMERV